MHESLTLQLESSATVTGLATPATWLGPARNCRGDGHHRRGRLSPRSSSRPAPGRQAQVDWGSTWAQIGEERGRVHLFVMVLGYSRRLYVEFTQEQRLATLLACQQQAFDWFGGLTEEI